MTTRMTFVSAEQQPVSTRCAAIRQRLEDFAAGRLGPQARGEVQGHLLDCEGCAEAFGMMLVEQVESGVLPELEPPTVPPPSLYDRYLQARRPESSWRALLDAAHDRARTATAAQVAKAKARLDEIRAGFEALALDTVAVRGSATRGSMRGGPPREVSADVLTPAGAPSGETVVFEVGAEPRITTDHRFEMTLSTSTAGYDGRIVICTIALPDGDAVSFEAAIEPAAKAGSPGDEWIARFDEERLPIADYKMPLWRLSLAIA